ncbi:hypothetical protein CCGE531_28285 (plasmid) [Rhizobium sp. CCGE531]|nr:hypothetical protein CCGE531_28285 [Rhizobium sp. CCGE531]AYG76346.1 hypothetical protein CCGE532_27760 [Rhizobium sp. CCGE532]
MGAAKEIAWAVSSPLYRLSSHGPLTVRMHRRHPAEMAEGKTASSSIHFSVLVLPALVALR